MLVLHPIIPITNDALWLCVHYPLYNVYLLGEESGCFLQAHWDGGECMRSSRNKRPLWFRGIIAGPLLALLPHTAFAGGFEVQQAAYFQGMSFAGVATGGPSIASLAWNPATSAFAGNGLTTEVSVAMVFTTADLTVPTGLPQGGATAVDVGRDSPLGASFATWRVDEKTVLGLSITAPFGLLTKPNNPDWAGRTDALTSKIFSLNATPSVSYEIMPGLAIGAGVQFQYFDLVRLTAATPLPPPFPLGAQVISDINGDDFGVGFMVGVNFSPAPGTSLGLGFRSSIHHQLEGDTTIGSIAQAPIRADIDLPDKVTFSFRQAVSPSARVLGTVDWANWSRFGVIPIVLQGALPDFAPAGATVANLDFRWRDGWLFALGGEYDWSPNLTMRAGVNYDISPVDSATARLLQVPDSNRVWVSVGASYKLSSASSIDLAYSHGFFENNAPFNRRPASVALPPLLGEADLSSDMISVSWKMRWGGPSYVAAPLK